ncbi:LysM peptidoglycan-binding domain-containing protein, partial [Variovorax sp. OV700]|uniref:LysM peptidoglycan-binding domain-containing protein n=1 Tax=Variovorax sp. OV700 TaxID=1882826 RepID=UPI000891D04B
TPLAQNGPLFSAQSDFSFGYQPIDGNYPAGSPGTYAVATGDTLQSIARGAYGDASLWYLIADANGLSSDADLRTGQVLRIPTRVGSADNASTFRPYDPSKIASDSATMMATPQAEDDGCGVVGQIIMVVIAVVVTIYTAGAAGAYFGAAGAAGAGGFAGGVAVLGGAGGLTAASIGAAVVGGAVGSIASQAVGVAIGAQDQFSWKQVALGAIGSGVTAGLGGGLINTGNVIGDAVVRGAVANSLTQGIAVATGLQSSFSWRSVAASAVGAGVAQGVSGAIGNSFGSDSFGQFANRAVSSFAGGITTAALRGGRVSATQVAVDAFGNALGESIAAANGQGSRVPGPIGADERAKILGMFGEGLSEPIDSVEAVKVGARNKVAPTSSALQPAAPSNVNPFLLAPGSQRLVDDGDGTVYDVDVNNKAKVVIDGAPAPAAGPGQRIQLNPYQLVSGASRVVDDGGNVYDVLQDGTIRSVIDGSSATKPEWQTVIRSDGFHYDYLQKQVDGVDINTVRTMPGAVRTSDDYGNVQDTLPNGTTRTIISVDSPLPVGQQLIINQGLQNSLTNLQDRGAEIRNWNNDTAKMAFYNAFGTADTEARSVVLQRIEGNIASNQSIDINNFQYASRNANPGWTDLDYNGTGAYVRRNDPSNTIYVGPALARGDIAQVLTHETSHWNGTGPIIPGSNPPITGTVDGYVDPKTGRIAIDATGKEISTYGVVDVRALAPNVALYHADTFGFYASDLIRPRTPSYSDYIGSQSSGTRR